MEDNKLLLLEQEFHNYKQLTDKEIHELQKIIEKQDERIKVMELSKQKTDFQYEQIMETLNNLNTVTIPNLTTQVEELKNKPVKRYDQAITSIIGAIFGAIGGVVVGLFIKP